MRRYHHLGLPTDALREGEHFLEKFDVHVVPFEASPYGVEWMRYGPSCPVPELVRRSPHLAFEVDDLEAEMRGKEVLIAPNSPSPGATCAFIVEGGAPVELLKLEGEAAAMGSLFRGGAETTDWETLPAVEAPGATGFSRVRTADGGAVRLRIVEYSPGYLADHWCHRGHAAYVLEGALILETRDGKEQILKKGSGFVGGGGSENPHRAKSSGGARVFIVD
jgi:quercetin dioxygenase-like cupin family protein